MNETHPKKTRYPIQELIRKLIHLLALVVPVGYLFFDKKTVAIGIGVGLVIALLVEWLRRKHLSFQQGFYRLLGPLLRKNERVQITGATYIITGSLICVLLFPKEVAIFGLFTVIVSDAMAAIVGQLLKGHKLHGKKTWEGTATFLICTGIFGWIFLAETFWLIVFVAFILSLVELFWKGPSDNLIIPIVAGLLVMGLGYLM